MNKLLLLFYYLSGFVVFSEKIQKERKVISLCQF